METGKIIKARRIELGMTQTELAEKTGYTARSAISKIENGSLDLNQSTIVKFANALQTTPAKLLGVNETMPMDKMLEAVGFDRKELENLTQTDYDLMLTLLKGIIESKQKK